jgi:hypothetical protein
MPGVVDNRYGGAVREGAFDELSGVAARQWGMITSAQARRLGVDDADLGQFRDVGLLMELDWDVHQVAGSTTGPRFAYPYAGWLAISPEDFAWERPASTADDAVLSHESASGLYGLGSLPASTMVFTAPRARPAPRAIRIHVARLTSDDVTVHKGVPVTTPHRTILDLVRDRTDHAAVGRAIIDAVRLDLVDLADLHAELAPWAARYGVPVEGPRFLGYVTQELRLRPESLSARNQRAYATLLAPDRVAGEGQQRG